MTPLGFTVLPEPAAYNYMQPLLPMQGHTTPDGYGIAIIGKVDSHPVQIITGEYVSRDNDGNETWGDVLLTIVEHPLVRGTAVVHPDWKHSTGGAILDKLLWIPPFTIVKFIQIVFDRQTPDLVIGEPTFDAMFKVNAESVAVAQEAIPPAARRYLVESHFDGMIVTRPGALVYRLGRAQVDAESVAATLAAASPLIAAFTQRTEGHPMR
ncbi:MAG: hypothetical protein U0269_23325 [Polyangiales bacterium]